MATKSLTITTDAYERLARAKRSGESFSDVITRIVPTHDWRALIGTLTDKEVSELAGHLRDVRKAMDKDFTRRGARW